MTIVYAAELLTLEELGRRIPRSVQSAAARRLEQRLVGGAPGEPAVSRSHSRCAVAAAVDLEGRARLGIDIEWMAPERNFVAIGRFAIGIAPQDAETFYRAWTFREAYFKAFQYDPSVDLVERVCARTEEKVPVELSPNTFFEQRAVAGVFRLCLVWNEDAVHSPARPAWRE